MPKTPRSRTFLAGLIVLAPLAAVALRGQPAAPDAVTAPAIRVDQAGYLPDATKIALVVTSAGAGSTARVRRQDGEEVLQVPVSEIRKDEHTGDSIRAIDFTALAQPGTYVISAAGLGESDPVHVRNDVYRRPLYLALRSFYGQRCGTEALPAAPRLGARDGGGRSSHLPALHRSAGQALRGPCGGAKTVARRCARDYRSNPSGPFVANHPVHFPTYRSLPCEES